MTKWEQYLEELGVVEQPAITEDADGVTTVLAWWPAKANGTVYDFRLIVRVYSDGSFFAALGTQVGNADELKAMARASYQVAKANGRIPTNG